MAESSVRLYDLHEHSYYGVQGKRPVQMKVLVSQSRDATGKYDSEDVLVNVGHRRTNAVQGEGWAGALGMPGSGFEDLVEEILEHDIRATSIRNLRRLEGKKGVRQHHLEHLLQDIEKFLLRLDLQITGVTPELIHLAEDAHRVVQRSQNLLGDESGTDIRLALRRELTRAKEECITIGCTGESGAGKSSYVNFCTTLEESLPHNHQNLSYCPGWLCTGDDGKDVTVIVAGLQYEAGVHYRPVLVPRTVEEYVTLVQEIADQANCPEAVESFGCYWEGDNLRVREKLSEGEHMRVRTLLSDPPAPGDVFTLKELEEESGSSDPVLWNRHLTRAIGERLSAQERLAAAMQLTTSKKVALQPQMIFCDLPGYGSAGAAGVNRVEQATLTAIAVKAATKMDVLVPMHSVRRPPEALLLQIFEKNLLTRKSILMMPFTKLSVHDREEQLKILIDDGARLVQTLDETDDGFAVHNIEEYIRLLHSEGCINVLDRKEKVQDYPGLMRLLCQRRNVKLDQLVADATFMYLGKLGRAHTKLSHKKPGSKTRAEPTTCMTFENDVLDGAFLGEKEDWLSKQRTLLQQKARKLDLDDKTASTTKLVASLRKVLEKLRGELAAAAMSFYKTRVGLVAESFFGSGENASWEAHQCFISECEPDFSRKVTTLLRESAPDLEKFKETQTARRRLRNTWRNRPDSTTADADTFYDGLVEILISESGLVGALYDWADKQVRQLSELALKHLRQVASERVPDQKDEPELVKLKTEWKALKKARRLHFFRLPIYANEERDLTEPLPKMKMSGPKPWNSKMEFPDGGVKGGRKRARTAGPSSSHSGHLSDANQVSHSENEMEEHIVVVRRAGGGFDFKMGTKALALTSAYDQKCRTLDQTKETVLVPTFLHLERQLGRPNPYELGLRDPQASMEPQQPRMKKVVAALYLVVTRQELLEEALQEAAKRKDTTVVELPRNVGLAESLEVVKGLAEALFSNEAEPHMPGMYAETIAYTEVVEHLSPKPRMSTRVPPERSILFAAEVLQRSQKEAAAPCLEYLLSPGNFLALNAAAQADPGDKDNVGRFLEELFKSAGISLPAVKAFLRTKLAASLPTMKSHVEACVASVPVIAVAGFRYSSTAVVELLKRAHATGCHDITYEFKGPGAFLAVFSIDALQPFSYPTATGAKERRNSSGSASMYTLIKGFQCVRLGFFRALKKAGCVLINCCAFAMEANQRRQKKPGWKPVSKRRTQKGRQAAKSAVKREHEPADAGPSGSQADRLLKRARRGQGAANFEGGQASESTPRKAAGREEPRVKIEAVEDLHAQEQPFDTRTRGDEEEAPRTHRPGKEVARSPSPSPPPPDTGSSEDEFSFADPNWDSDDEEDGRYSDADDMFESGE